MKNSVEQSEGGDLSKRWRSCAIRLACAGHGESDEWNSAVEELANLLACEREQGVTPENAP